MRRIWNKTISLLLAMTLVCGLLGSISMTAKAEDAPVETVAALQEGLPYPMEGDEGEVYFSFTPLESGTYRFYSVDKTAESDPYATLYDAQLNELTGDDDSGENYMYSIMTQLEAGTTYYLVVGAYSDAPYAVCVEKILAVREITVTGSIELMENQGGYETDGDNGRYYHYIDYYVTDKNRENVQFTITYEDGSTYETGYFTTLNGMPGELDFDGDEQYESPWLPTTEQSGTFSYMGCTVEVPVTIAENPVESIEVIPVTTEFVLGERTYMRATGGGYYHGWNPGVIGGQLKVTYKDSSVETYLIDEDMMCEGYELSVRGFSTNTAGEQTVTCTWLGASTTFTVNVVEPTLASIEVVRAPDITTARFTPNLIGMQLKLTDKEGAEKTVTVTEDNLCYDIQNLGHYIDAGDTWIVVEPAYTYDEETDEEWLSGWKFGAQTCSYTYEDITIETNDVTKIVLSEVSMDIEGTVLDVTYADGVTKKYVIQNPTIIFQDVDYAYAWFLTEDGFINYEITSYDDDGDGEVDRYIAYCNYNRVAYNVDIEGGNTAPDTPDAGGDVTDNNQPGKEDDGKSDSGEEETEVTVPATTLKKVKAKKKALTVKWKKTAGVTGYEVQVALNKKFKKGLKSKTVKSGSKTSVTIKKLKAKKKYFVRVRAYKVVNGKKYISSWSNLKFKKTK